ncbi:unnamed protein product, partial [Gulo gulo]
GRSRTPSCDTGHTCIGSEGERSGQTGALDLIKRGRSFKRRYHQF